MSTLTPSFPAWARPSRAENLALGVAASLERMVAARMRRRALTAAGAAEAASARTRDERSDREAERWMGMLPR